MNANDGSTLKNKLTVLHRNGRIEAIRINGAEMLTDPEGPVKVVLDGATRTLEARLVFMDAEFISAEG